MRELRRLQLKKVPGSDGLSNEMLRHLGPVARGALLPSSTAPGVRLMSRSSGSRRRCSDKLITFVPYLDIKKAFDTVCLDISLKKLAFIGIRGKLLKILKSYLIYRKQRALINTQYSDEANVEVAVPQGSILGPLLFIMIYIKDISNISNQASICLFADDTAVTVKVKDLPAPHLLGGYFEAPPLVLLRCLLNRCRSHHQPCSTISRNNCTHYVNIFSPGYHRSAKHYARVTSCPADFERK